MLDSEVEKIPVGRRLCVKQDRKDSTITRFSMSNQRRRKEADRKQPWG